MLLTTGQAAAALRTSRDTIRRLCNSGELNCIRFTQRGWVWIEYDSIQDYAERRNIRLGSEEKETG